MTKVLLTAFEPYGEWQVNASWLALMELTKSIPEQPQLTTRLYPVDFEEVQKKLEEDLVGNYDFAIHLGQSPGSTALALEQVAINFGADPHVADSGQPLVADGPAAYQTDLPLAEWAESLRKQGVPAAVSHHAGTYLCNATMYLSMYHIGRLGLATRCMFLHLPLETSQAAGATPIPASLPSSIAAKGILQILTQLPQLALI